MELNTNIKTNTDKTNEIKNIEKFAPKICQFCGVTFYRKRHGKAREIYRDYSLRRHCSQKCANSKKEKTSSSALHEAARAHLKDKCENCGVGMNRLYAHHRDFDIKNNSPENIQTLCHNCHKEIHNGKAGPGREPTF